MYSFINILQKFAHTHILLKEDEPAAFQSHIYVAILIFHSLKYRATVCFRSTPIIIIIFS